MVNFQTVAAASVVAGVFGLAAVEPVHYRFWFSWARRLFIAGVLALLVGNAVAGFLGVVFAELTNLQPFGADRKILNGIVYGLTAQALVRVDLTLAGASPTHGPATALRRVVGWLVSFLDGEADDRCAARFNKATDTELREAAFATYHGCVKADPDTPDVMKKHFLREVTNAAKKFDQTPNDPEARAVLASFCRGWITKKHLSAARAGIR